jgi:hypothetical protein
VPVASHLLAPRLTQCASFFRSCPVHIAEHTPSSRLEQSAEFSRRGNRVPAEAAKVAKSVASSRGEVQALRSCVSREGQRDQIGNGARFVRRVIELHSRHRRESSRR